MKNKKFAIVLTLFISIQVLVFGYLIDSNNDKIDTLLKSESDIILSQYNSLYDSTKDLADTVFYGYINKPELIELIAKNKREELYKKLYDSYKYLQAINFKQIHFHTKDNISFLRMHKSDKFGDDLSDFRYSVKYVNQTGQPISGLEVGRIIPGFRYVYPLSLNNQHIGSVETSFHIKVFTEKLKKLFGVHTNFLIKKEIFDQKVFDTSKINYEQSIESDRYIYLKSIVDEKIYSNYEKIKEDLSKSIKTRIDKGLREEKLFSIDAKINGFYKIITFLPVKNIEQQHLGYFVVYRNSERLANVHSQLIYKLIIVSILISGFFLFLYRQMSFKDKLEKEVDIKTKELLEMTRQLEEKTVQLEELNESLEIRIEQEVEKNARQERELFQQSKQAALGDMIGNIAHQWRQPLSAISSSASGMQLTYQVGSLEDKYFFEFTDAIINNANYLSQTIDNFRDFIKSEKIVKRFDLNQAVAKSLGIVNSSISNHNLKVVTNFAKEELFVVNYENEFQQAFINIFSNAKDALKNKVEQENQRCILVTTYKHDKKICIEIHDSAGGVSEEIIDKIFEPYFTTKHQSQGTGLGLYMTHKIIVESMKGSLSVENQSFELENKKFYGAKFTIELNEA
ncbi:MAG: hypothetical protein IE909_00100 [Campylobacterales bacterium]|nr:hypothetical protein [Campylobacterales bacterium]